MSAWLAVCTSLITAVVVSPHANADDRPRYQNLRYQEIWSGIAQDEANTSRDPFDPLKFAPLNADKSSWVSFGGQLRSRVEIFDGFGFGGAGQRSDAYWLNRFRYHADFHLGENARVFLEMKHSLSSDRDLPGGRRATEHDQVALQNAFVELSTSHGNQRLRLRAGRQELLLGSQRLVSPRDFSNIRRTWDGANVTLTGETFDLTALWAALSVEREIGFNESSNATQLYGAYLQNDRESWTWDAYLLGVRSAAATFNGTTGSEDRVTLGSRVETSAGIDALRLEAEAAYQVGEVGSSSVNAYMAGAEATYAIADTPWNPQLMLGVEFGSGDRSAGGSVQTFNTLFPSGRLYYGHSNTLGRPNLFDVTPGVSCHPLPELLLETRAHALWRSSRKDGIYTPTGGLLRAGNLGSSREVGLEVDLTATYSVDRHLSVLVGFNQLFAGRFIRQSGSSDDVQFSYFQLQYTF